MPSRNTTRSGSGNLGRVGSRSLRRANSHNPSSQQLRRFDSLGSNRPSSVPSPQKVYSLGKSSSIQNYQQLNKQESLRQKIELIKHRVDSSRSNYIPFSNIHGLSYDPNRTGGYSAKESSRRSSFLRGFGIKVPSFKNTNNFPTRNPSRDYSDYILVRGADDRRRVLQGGSSSGSGKRSWSELTRQASRSAQTERGTRRGRGSGR